MFDDLSRDEKLRLLRFLCSFAWADLEINPEERALVARLVDRMALDADDAAEAMAWLDHPPREDDLDPYDIPDAHKRLFLDAALAMMGADGVVDTMEVESFALFESLMGVVDDEDDEPA